MVAIPLTSACTSSHTSGHHALSSAAKDSKSLRKLRRSLAAPFMFPCPSMVACLPRFSSASVSCRTDADSSVRSYKGQNCPEKGCRKPRHSKDKGISGEVKHRPLAGLPPAGRCSKALQSPQKVSSRNQLLTNCWAAPGLLVVLQDGRRTRPNSFLMHTLWQRGVRDRKSMPPAARLEDRQTRHALASDLVAGSQFRPWSWKQFHYLQA